MSHRGPEFISIYKQAVADLRELLDVPPNYRILFQQGGGLGQNSIIPLNLAGRRAQPATIDFVHTGSWSGKSLKEAARYANVNVAASAKDNSFTAVPPQDTWKLSKDAAYLHICTNETIDGVEYNFVPGRREQVRRDLRWRAKEHRPGRPDAGHRARGLA
jgi:phosphoserine aminotransferase